MMIMYERIRNLREDEGMTQTEIATYLNCSQRIYSNYERGEVDIPTEILIKLDSIEDVGMEVLSESDEYFDILKRCFYKKGEQ
jgi:transcriptional regulator with XRE-family HTH domain